MAAFKTKGLDAVTSKVDVASKGRVPRTEAWDTPM